MIKLKPEVKQKLLERMRSGEYIQSDTYMRTAGDRWDALGMLCEIAREAGIGKWVINEGDEFYRFTADGETCVSLPPFAVANFATEGELSTVDYDSSDDGFWVIYQEKASISELNDMGFCLPLQAELVELYW